MWLRRWVQDKECHVRVFGEASVKPDANAGQEKNVPKVNREGLRIKLGNRTQESGKNYPRDKGLPISSAVGVASNSNAHFRFRLNMRPSRLRNLSSVTCVTRKFCESS